MQGKKRFEPKMYYNVSLDDLVPKDNFYRLIEEVLDLRFLYKECKGFYGRTGKPSIDPVVFFKLLLFGYFENIISDRELVRKASDSLSARYFLGYDIDEELPWHSTISRTRSIIPEDVFEKLFEKVLNKCIESGIVGGDHQSIDSTLVKANASLDNLRQKMKISGLKDHVEKVRKENKEQEEDDEENENKPTGGLKKKTTSNKDYESKTDPDSRIVKKGRNRTDLYYKTHYSVDSKSNVITDVSSVYADTGDSKSIIDIIEKASKRLRKHNLKVKSVSADKGYCSGENLREIENKSIIPYIPREKNENKTGGYDIKEFIYNAKEDYYKCPGDKKLKYFYYKKDKSSRAYYAQKEDCGGCKLKKHCTKAEKRIIHRSDYLEYIDRLETRMNTVESKTAMYYRKTGPELLFAEAKNNHGLKKYMSRGLCNANKNSFMIATVQNLKRLIKQIKKREIEACRKISELLFPEIHVVTLDPV
jgi:transposase